MRPPPLSAFHPYLILIRFLVLPTVPCLIVASRAALGISKAVDILDHIYSLPNSEQETAQAKIRAIEARAMLLQEAQPGLLDLVEYLEKKEIRMALCTRNFE